MWVLKQATDDNTNTNSKIPNGIERSDEEKENKENQLEINLENVNLHLPESATVSPITRKKLSIRDFEKVKELGRGAYAKVDLAKYKSNKTELIAIKILDKHFMDKLNKSHEAYIEKEILRKVNHPNVISLISTFQDKNKLYFVLEYATNKDLATFVRSQGVLSYDLAQFFTAEIVNAIEYLHAKSIAHRDLKPENIILDENMHIKIVKYIHINSLD
jgi:3-phosphoinositide dependent protein kinase-1